MSSRKFTDQLHREITLTDIPERIISTVPSQTSLLCALGLEDKIVGITKFCVHPESCFRSKKKIGGTKNLRIEDIKNLEPDFILANKEENVKEHILDLAESYPAWISDVQNLDDNYDLIQQVGQMFHKESRAQSLIEEIKMEFDLLDKQLKKRVKAAYLIWKGPYMTVGHDTFIHYMMEQMGFDNVFGDRGRYPKTSLAEIRERVPDVVLLSSEPYPFADKHLAEIQEETGIESHLVDGQMFSWYGDLIIKAPRYALKLHSDLNL